MRTSGAKNVVPFEGRNSIDTSNGANVRHLADIKGTPLVEFCGLLRHQQNFLDWVETRHDSIVNLKSQINTLQNKSKGKGPTGAKDATFRKYRWFAEQLVLLEAINAFEAFYKKTFVGLGTVLQTYVLPKADRVVKISELELWNAAGQAVFPSLVPSLAFEHELFHDLDNVDRASETLIGRRRYQKKLQANPLADRVKALCGIFQIRHTLSHNSGRVTDGDRAKFTDLKFLITAQEIIDPMKNQLGIAILRTLGTEAQEFTHWLANGTATFLTECINMRAIRVPAAKRQELELLFGAHQSFANVPWG
jgi:hypothetical protein